MQLVVQPTQWSSVPHVETIDKDFTADDAACLAEVRAVLAKHGALDRFGIMLLHKHFEIADDECLLETIDTEQRTLMVRPIPRAELGNAMQTQWRLSQADPLQWCEVYCHRLPHGDHRNGHQPHIEQRR